MSVLVPVSCTACKYKGGCLSGTGPANTKLMVVSEFPWSDEVKAGRPFSNEKGLLQKTIIKNMLGLDPITDVYYTYAIKGDLKGDSIDGKSKEVRTCRNWLLREIKTVNPKLILVTGNIAKHAVLGEQFPFTDYRGHLVEEPMFGWKVFITWNTSYVDRYSSYRLTGKQKIREFKTGSVPWFYKRDMEKLKSILDQL